MSPCVFQIGDFEGYFGSLTSFTNGLPAAEAGECESKNQLDQRITPALVMAGGDNPVKAFKAKVGDLLVAFNPQNGVATAAIIGDSGPADNLGEGSVGLNMTLLKKRDQPKTYAEAKSLDTGRDQMLIAIFPETVNFRPRKPFTKENVSERVNAWLAQAGFVNQETFVEFIKNCLR
jgi:hypothetical protein